MLATAFFLGLGALFVAQGIQDESSFTIAAGGCFAAFGIAFLLYSLRIKAPKK
jgi:hypothetical protein